MAWISIFLCSQLPLNVSFSLSTSRTSKGRIGTFLGPGREDRRLPGKNLLEFYRFCDFVSSKRLSPYPLLSERFLESVMRSIVLASYSTLLGRKGVDSVSLGSSDMDECLQLETMWTRFSDLLGRRIDFMRKRFCDEPRSFTYLYTSLNSTILSSIYFKIAPRSPLP